MRWLAVLVAFVVIVLAISASQREQILRDTQFLRDPYHRWRAKSRVEQIATMLEADAAQGRALPNRLDFPEYLRRQTPDSADMVDPWGTPYYLRPEVFSVRVGSAGQDRVVGTEDDILSRLVEGRELRQPADTGTAAVDSVGTRAAAPR